MLNTELWLVTILNTEIWLVPYAIRNILIGCRQGYLNSLHSEHDQCPKLAMCEAMDMVSSMDSSVARTVGLLAYNHAARLSKIFLTLLGQIFLGRMVLRSPQTMYLSAATVYVGVSIPVGSPTSIINIQIWPCYQHEPTVYGNILSFVETSARITFT